MSLVELEVVSRSYSAVGRRRRGRVRAVEGISLAIAAGETLGLVGESGCGKSTTGRLALGIEPAESGEVRFDGAVLPPADTTAWRALRARMQMVFQDPLGALDRHMTIGAQIAEPLAIHAIGAKAERGERVADLMRQVGLDPAFALRHPHALSGGQRQRAVLARALATDPAFLVCDEPVSALDVSVQAQVVNLLAELRAARGLAMLFISHDLRVVRQVSDRIAVMYLGRIVEQGAPDALLGQPLHPYTQALVSAVPGAAGTRVLLGGEPPDPAQRPAGCGFAPRCPVAVTRCHSEPPLLRPRGAVHAVSCHLADVSAVAA